MMTSAEAVPLTCQKHLFSLPSEIHYLNCAYMSPLSRDVEAAGVAAVRRKSDPSKISSRDFFEDSDRVRGLFSELINVENPERIAIIPAVSYGVATVVNNLEVRAGQNIVLTREQFPSNVYAWKRFEGQGVDVRFVAPPKTVQSRGQLWNQRLFEAIDGDTAAVALGHVHWTDGTRFDLLELGRRAREVGAALIIDGTQSVGALPFDVTLLQPDALICAGYKWLLGPYGIGLAYYGPRFDNGRPLEEGWIVRLGSENFSGLVDYQDGYQPGALRYDVGERSSFTLTPMIKRALEHLLAWGVEEIQSYCRELTCDLFDEARALGYQVEDEAWRSAHLFGLRLPEGLDPHRLQQRLEQRRISVSVRGSAVRISPHVYNDQQDIAALLEALKEART
ncbi:MAG: aminotransferase class V-fold PLP-dependent enzyme [Trueperaceae bacterium]|nr:MAG: aminotransferase class V-fold PLP-dependent enzyme [Trueperaceae bacterium]